MSKNCGLKLLLSALFLAVSLPVCSQVLKLCTPGSKQYKPKGDCGTSVSTCCDSGIWSGWDKSCGYFWSCRQVPKSYCRGTTGGLPATVSGSLQGKSCSEYGKEGFSSGTTNGDGMLIDGSNSACYQCACGYMPTSPACNCSGTASGSCTAYINGAAYVGTRKCVASCLWDDCYSISNPEGQYCGLTPGKTYQCTPAAYPEHGGYQVCESAYDEPGQLKISACIACGANQCLAKSGGLGSDARYYCVSKPTSGSDNKGKYNCTAATCRNAGMTTSPWTCTAKTYTSCYSGYTLSGGNCVSNSGGGGGSTIIKPIDPSLPSLKL